MGFSPHLCFWKTKIPRQVFAGSFSTFIGSLPLEVTEVLSLRFAVPNSWEWDAIKPST